MEWRAWIYFLSQYFKLKRVILLFYIACQASSFWYAAPSGLLRRVLFHRWALPIVNILCPFRAKFLPKARLEWQNPPLACHSELSEESRVMIELRCEYWDVRYSFGINVGWISKKENTLGMSFWTKWRIPRSNGTNHNYNTFTESYWLFSLTPFSRQGFFLA